jgi:hypothetical protein
MKNQLPELSSMILPAFFTLRKNKNIAQAGIQINKIFRGVEIEKSKLEGFREYFGFQTSIPLTYLYTIAQRAQTALMLDKQFTLPIPGMIHIENYLNKYAELDPNIPFDITSSTSVDYKESGSLKPVFLVELSQNGNTVAACKSIYIIKRKSKTKKSKKTEVDSLHQIDQRVVWKLNPKTGREYTRVSGDKNPIHTSLIFAKMLGFERTIMHGWYSICKIEQFLENNEGASISEIVVNFLSPVLLPSQPEFVLQNNKDEGFNYQLVSGASNRILLNGMMK